MGAPSLFTPLIPFHLSSIGLWAMSAGSPPSITNSAPCIGELEARRRSSGTWPWAQMPQSGNQVLPAGEDFVDRCELPGQADGPPNHKGVRCDVESIKEMAVQTSDRSSVGSGKEAAG